MNIENIFDYIRYACFYYVPDKANMKKIKQLFEAIPYFVSKEHQNKLFKIVIENPIESYYDTSENMNEYGYLIYKEFHKELNLRVKEYPEYIRGLYTPYDDSAYKRKRTHTILFVIIVLLLLYYIYSISKTSCAEN
jgi:hypothetical protein